MAELEIELDDASCPSELQQPRSKKTTFLYAILGQGLFSLTRLGTSMLVGGRFLSGTPGTGSEAELGGYLAYFSLLLLCISALEAFVTLPMTFLIHTRQGEDRKRFSSFMLLLCTVLTIVFGAGCLVVGFALQLFGQPVFTGALWAFFALIVSQFLREFLVRWILARLDSHQYAILEIVYFLLYLPALAILLFAGQVNVVNVFWIMTLLNVVVIGIWWALYRDEFARLSVEELKQRESALWREFVPTIREQVYFGRWLALDAACALATVYFCNWFLLFTVSAQGAGVYGACMIVVLLVNPFLNGLMSVFAPMAAMAFEDGGKPAVTKLVFKVGLPLVCAMAAFSFFLWFAGEGLTNVFFGDRYANYFEEHYGGKNRITFLIGLTLPATAGAYLLASAVMACGKPQYTFLSSLFGLITLLVACALLVESNLEQCAIAFGVSVLVMAVSRLLLFKKL